MIIGKWRAKLVFRKAQKKKVESKKTSKIIMSVLLSACCTGMASGNTYAQNATGTLGVCNIGNPIYQK